MILLQYVNIILLLRILTESNKFFYFFFINISPPTRSNKSSFYEDCYEYCTTYMYIYNTPVPTYSKFSILVNLNILIGNSSQRCCHLRNLLFQCSVVARTLGQVQLCNRMPRFAWYVSLLLHSCFMHHHPDSSFTHCYVANSYLLIPTTTYAFSFYR